mgnify:FL=1
MLGLLYKDFYTAKKELMLTGFMALVFLLYNLVIGQKEMLGPSIGVLVSVGSMVPTYSIHYDKVNGWNKFVCASPISRTQVVLSKYISGMFSVVLMNLLIVVNNWAAGSPLPVWSYPLFLCLTWFIQAVMIPVCLKLGQNMVVVVFMLMVFLPIAILFGLNRLGIWTDAGIQSAFDFLQQNTMVLVTVGSIVAVALYILSFFLTLYFYKKMEF